MNNKRFKKKLQRIKKRQERQKQIYELTNQYAKYKPRQKVSNIMLAIIVLAIIGYVIADFVLMYQTSTSIDSTITACWFAFWTTEILALTGIKVTKVKNGITSTLNSLGYQKPDGEECSCDEENE